jgi:hypothetical protein
MFGMQFLVNFYFIEKVDKNCIRELSYTVGTVFTV